ncbi:MAG: hypothetical protein LAN63_02010 [Acidobacteriia bacterium]|nr:hypothetical protein [Terriglobia bacterium]
MSFGMRHLQVAAFVACCTVAAAAQQSNQVPQEHVGHVLDWTSHHIAVSGGLDAANLRAAQADPRILFHLVERNLIMRHDDPGELPSPILVPPTRKWIDGGGGTDRKNMKIDWSVSLGNGTVAANMFPAKYGFDTNGTPDCTKDYVVFGLNVVAANLGQANLVGINNLYSGNPSGLCGANPTVNWAYNGTTAAGGAVRTAVTISLDGTKVAYVESGTSSAVFHILTWHAGQGTVNSATTPTKPPNCTAATSCLKSLTFSATITASLASPWVDYASDKAFVASDDGKIYRMSCVFKCALNSNPTVDWTFTLPVAGSGGSQPKPNGPVYNSPNGLLFMGDQLGEIWVINASGSTPSLFAGPMMIGGGGCTTTNPPGRTGTPSPCTASGGAFGIPDSVILDASGASQKIFAFSGNDGTPGASAVVAQMNQDLTGLVRVHVGRGSVGLGSGSVDLHSGTFDDSYWGNDPSTGELFLCGTGPGNTNPYHYWIGFASYPVMDSTPTGMLQRLNAAGVACTPYNEFYNPNLNLGGVAGHHDLLVSGLVDPVNGYVITNDISTGSIPAALNFVNYPGGISGVIVDNDSLAAQASSVYFSTLTTVNVGTCANARCAVKLTQAALQ